VGQARSGVPLHRWYVFSFLFHFFFANSLFAAQSTPSTLLVNGHGPPLPRGPTSSNYQPRRRQGRMATLTCPLTCPHLTWSLHPHTPCRRASAARTAATASPCPSRLHALRHRACARFPLLVCFLFSFSANSHFFQSTHHALAAPRGTTIMTATPHMV
jgi:hypothetical protein